MTEAAGYSTVRNPLDSMAYSETYAEFECLECLGSLELVAPGATLREVVAAAEKHLAVCDA